MNILTLKSQLEGVLHGTTLNQITNIDRLIDRAARTMLLEIDPMETKRISPLPTPIYSDLFDYALPVDLKGNKIIDIRPAITRNSGDFISQTYNQSFDKGKNTKNKSQFTINFDAAVKTLRLNDTSLPKGTILDDMDETTGWVVSGDDGNGLFLDKQNYISGKSSIKVTTNALGTDLTLTKTITEPLDLTEFKDNSTISVYVYIKDTPTNVTSITLRVGSSFGNYYDSTVYQTASQTAFDVGWNLISFPNIWLNDVGAPDITAIDYIFLEVGLTAGATSYLNFDNILCVGGKQMEIEYYSKYLFRDALTNTFQEEVSDDSNLINLDTDSFNIFFNLCAFYCVQQQQGASGLAFDSNFFGQEYLKAKQRYQLLYRSEVQKPQEMYYQPQKPGYTQYIGRRFGY